MSAPMPANATTLQRLQAELNDLRWVASHSMATHDHAAKALAEKFPDRGLSDLCVCSTCRRSRPWVESPTPFPPASELASGR